MTRVETPKKQSTFLAWVFRMPLIKRWGLMHCFRPENVAEHSHQVAAVAHLLAVIKNTRYGGNLDPNRAATMGLYHDVSETRLLDSPTPVKYHNPEFTKQYKKMELLAEQECLDTLPDDLKSAYASLIVSSEFDKEYKTIIKAADIICAYIKTLDELKYGNKEFSSVKTNMEDRLEQFSDTMPEVRDCLDIFCNSCTATIDQLNA